MCANSEGSGETARMPRLTWAFAGHLCDKYYNLMSWLFHSEGSGETARMPRLTWAFAGHLCDKYYNLMSWLFHSSDVHTKQGYTTAMAVREKPHVVNKL